ncbi:beta-N-acetylhexosaminidase [Ornithinibacillus massiliensis]|uniref:Beta-N-acetylhexosaminidase n=1 Tax=Ornithinibacillus massiliensis TaxID=1944633 RepID=A0ABS5MGF4_9BACI|nr:beta-N-acetylhexosaminidase [Ornithinibacillus massiliensis]MBS3681415.1 beta-N-acetylhexosaminidase [Ornithinibacillus massiliensis]
MKRFLVIIGITVILLITLAIVNNADNRSTSSVKDAQQARHHPVEKSLDQQSSINRFISDIQAQAKEGKLPGVSFIAGETLLDDVTDQWGDPADSSPSGETVYIDYPDKKVALGYNGDIIFDIRSFEDRLSDIRFADIIKSLGEADEQRYYEDDQVDQIILVYQVNGTYQLKWVLPRPTDKEGNPALHHISLSIDPTKLTSNQPSVLETLTLDEKIGQMIMAGIEGTTPEPETIRLIENYKVGGIIFFRKNLTSYSQSLQLVNGIKRVNSVNPIPLFLSVDQEGGRVTRLPGLEELPTNKEIGLRNDPKLSYQIGSILAEALHAFGMNMNYAPVIDVNSNPKNPVIGDRSFGDNPSLVSTLGIQTMKGMEANDIIPVVKHFPGHGDTSVDSHLELPQIDKSLEALHELELIPFIDAIDEGADVVMVAHILFPLLDSEFPSSMSKAIMTDLLREELHFDGVIVTDDMNMDAIVNHYEPGEAAVQSVKAGSDVILISKEYDDIVRSIEAIKSAVEKGEISEERINESVQRILAVKGKYQITDEQVAYYDLEQINKKIKEEQQ